MFDAFELSARSRPVHLFRFARQSLAWRYCSADRDITVGDETFLHAPIQRSEIKQTVEKPQDQITITLPYLLAPNAPEYPVTQPLGDNWNPYAPTDTVHVTCMAMHLGDHDKEMIVEWMGRVASPEFTDGTLTLTCAPRKNYSAMLRRGPKWQRSCWKTIYAPAPRGAGLKREDYEFPATLTAASGVTLKAAEFATSVWPLEGGELSWTRANGITETRMILAHAGDTITILYPGPDLAVGSAVVALPTCPHTWDAYAARNNTINYGGSLYMPTQDPYAGQSMSWGG